MMTKKILALALCFIAVLSVCACKNKETENSDKAGEKVTDVKIATNILKLLNKLEEHDDVQNVYANFDISEELMESIDI